MQAHHRLNAGSNDLDRSSADQASTLWQLSCAALILVILIGIANLFTSRASASHAVGWDPSVSAYWRQNNMHSREAAETICVISSSRDQHVSAAKFRRTLKDKLYKYNNAGQLNPPNWDQLADGKISFVLDDGTGTPDKPQQCHEMTRAQRSAIAVEAYLAHRVDLDQPEFPKSACAVRYPGLNASCTYNTFRVWNSTVNNWVTAYSYVWFREGALYKSTHAEIIDPQWVISHEFGHVLGLADGLDGTDCTSVMHAGKHKNCPITNDTLWPNANDRASVTKIASSGQPQTGQPRPSSHRFLPNIQHD